MLADNPRTLVVGTSVQNPQMQDTRPPARLMQGATAIAGNQAVTRNFTNLMPAVPTQLHTSTAVQCNRR
jgi:hypothetical protein